MPATRTPTAIQKSQPAATDHRALVAEGLSALERLAGDQWTDYNEHDPGVTLLEALAYVLTDLGYRADLAIPDLMTDASGKMDLSGACLFTPPEIFPCAPVTLLDLRKILLDQLPGLANAWLTPSAIYPPGHHDVWLLPASPPAHLTEAERSALEGAAMQCLNHYRQLGDVFDTVTIVAVEPIHLILSLRITLDAVPERVLQEARSAVAGALNPPIPFQPYPGPSEGGPAPELLFEGPLLSRGSIQDADLWEPWTWDQVQTIVTQALLSLDDVEEILQLSLKQVRSLDDGPCAFSWDPWDKGNEISMVQGRSLWTPDAGDDGGPPARPLPRGPVTGIDVPKLWADSVAPGTFADVRRYEPVQDNLPPCYKMERNALPPDAPPQRVAEVRQLRAYLFVFEQLLANAFAQLAHAPELLSCREPAPAYVWQPLYDLEGARDVLQGTQALPQGATPQASMAAWTSYKEDAANPYAAGMRAVVDGWNEAFGDPDAFLDHLLARFAESLPTVDFENFETPEQKRRYLARYPELSANRHRAFDLGLALAHQQPKPTPHNVSELERRVNLLLSAGPREPLRAYDELPDGWKYPFLGGGVGPVDPHYLGRCYYLMEYPLFLRPPERGSPRVDPPQQQGVELPKAPFSLRILHVLTNWTWWIPIRPGFQGYVESFIRRSAPAHLVQGFLWLEPDEMYEFTTLLEQWYADELRPLRVLDSTETTVLVDPSGAAYELVRWLDAAMARHDVGG